MPKKEAPKKPTPKKKAPKQEGPKKVKDLIKAINDQLKDSLSNEYVTRTRKSPSTSTETPPKTKNLSELDRKGLSATVKYAVEGKWQTDNPPGGNLRIKGDKMVKAIANLKKIQPEKRD